MRPLAKIIEDAARRFRERPLHRASIAARRELGEPCPCFSCKLAEQGLAPGPEAK